METKGRYIGYEPISGYLTVSVGRLPMDGLEALEKLRDKEIDVALKIHREKRSLDSNSYFHVLVGKIADVLGASKIEIKNKMIRDYGQYQYIDDVIPTYLVKPEFVESMLNNPAIHFTQVGYEGDRAKLAVMKGSHELDSKEMATLIAGVVEEAKALGIETKTPQELEEMNRAWRAKYGSDF